MATSQCEDLSSLYTYYSNEFPNVVDALYLIIKLKDYFTISGTTISFSEKERPDILHPYLVLELNKLIQKELCFEVRGASIDILQKLKYEKIRNILSGDHSENTFTELKHIYHYNNFIYSILYTNFDLIRTNIKYLNDNHHNFEIFYGCPNNNCKNYIVKQKKCLKCNLDYQFIILNYINYEGRNRTSSFLQEVSIISSLFYYKLNYLKDFYYKMKHYLESLAINITHIKKYLSEDDSKKFLYEYNDFNNFYNKFLYREFISLLKSLNVSYAEKNILTQ